MAHNIWIWQQPEWPNFRWDSSAIATLLPRVRAKQGKLVGTMSGLGFDMQNNASLETMVEDVVRSSEIEGVLLNADRVRSSIARHLGVEIEGLPEPDHYTEGIVQVMMDAVQHAEKPLTAERLFDWHAALFPTGRSGAYKIIVATWRVGEEPMQVVSGPMGKETVHYEAPASSDVPHQMQLFFDWINAEPTVDPVLKAAIAHFYFVAIHPMDDGNGRLTRTITDMLLARADGMPHRFYSMSAAILKHKNKYYEILEHTSRGDVDITEWLVWFLETLEGAIDDAQTKVERIVRKALFWQKHREVVMNERQLKIVNRMWDGIEGKMSSGKYAKMAHTSQATAFRDIEELIEKGILRKAEEGGRSTNYELIEE